MAHTIRHIPLGESLPVNNPHAISVSLPTLGDIIGYEENRPEIMNRLKSGYPRFFKNRLVLRLEEYVRGLHGVSHTEVLLPIASLQAKRVIETIFEERFDAVALEEVCFLIFPENHPKLPLVKKIIQNIGAIIGSRQAENMLYRKGVIDALFVEERTEVDHPETEIVHLLAKAYCAQPENTYLTNSGANAVFAAIETLTKIQERRGRTINVQLGWLYLDSIEVIKKRSRDNYLYINIHQKELFEDWLERHHTKVANIIAETISNPILQCLDLPWIASLCQKYKIGLILDHTMATPISARAFPYCDIVVESLSKFASGDATVLMGALIVNEGSIFKEEILREVGKQLFPPYLSDCQRLLHLIQKYETRMETIAQNTFRLYNYLKGQDYIERIYSVYEEESWQNFQKIRNGESHIGLITLIFKKPLAQCYDRLNFSKGPSLGTEFTLAMPYTYLAHYDLLQTTEGRAFLEEVGLDARIVRISVGTEPIEEIIAEFERIGHNH